MKKMFNSINIQLRLGENPQSLPTRMVRKLMRRNWISKLGNQQTEQENQQLEEQVTDDEMQAQEEELHDSAEVNVQPAEETQQSEQQEEDKPYHAKNVLNTWCGYMVFGIFLGKVLEELFKPEIETVASFLRTTASELLPITAMLWTAVRDGLGL